MVVVYAYINNNINSIMNSAKQMNKELNTWHVNRNMISDKQINK